MNAKGEKEGVIEEEGEKKRATQLPMLYKEFRSKTVLPCQFLCIRSDLYFQGIYFKDPLEGKNLKIFCTLKWKRRVDEP